MRVHLTLTTIAATAALVSCSQQTPIAPLSITSSARSTPGAVHDRGYETLHIFSGSVDDGAYPNGGLTLIGSKIYGTTAGGGVGGQGTIYTTTAQGNVQIVYLFGSTYSYGVNPDGPVASVDGALYGTTQSGGDGQIYGVSVGGRSIFDVGLYGQYGGHPYDGVVLVNGTMYLTTYDGGTYGGGTVLAIQPSTSSYNYPTVVHSFGASGDGANPMAGLIYRKGALFGTTYNGGANNAGTVFSLTLSGTEHVLHSFGSSSGDGANPRGGLLHFGKLFYGTTVNGGTSGFGTVYSIASSGHEMVLHSFGGPPDGVAPFDQLISYRGVLYGTTYDGGSGGCASSNGCGTVFMMTPKGRETVLHSFTSNPDGSHPWAGLVVAPGGMYGAATLGGTGVGTIFRIAR